MTSGQSGRLKRKFIASFAVHGNVTAACQEAGIKRRGTVYDWCDEDDEFKAAFTEAESMATENLEYEARRRAVDGVEEPVYHNGHVVGSVWKYSDTLLIFLLKARSPEKYRDNAKIEHVGSGGGPIEIKPIDYRQAVGPLLTDGE